MRVFAENNKLTVAEQGLQIKMEQKEANTMICLQKNANIFWDKVAVKSFLKQRK